MNGKPGLTKAAWKASRKRSRSANDGPINYPMKQLRKYCIFGRLIISDLKEGVFFAKVVCENDSKTIEIDSRPSDAIAIGLRFNAPIAIMILP